MGVAAGKIMRLGIRGIAVWASLVAFAADEARAQSGDTIKMIVETSPGGVTDTIARLLADQIGRMQGPTMVIENHPGAGGAIGDALVTRAAPDGRTLLTAGVPFVINPLLRKVDYDPLTGFEPICELVTSPPLIVVNGASPYKTMADVFHAARSKPGELTVAAIGPGSPQQIGFEVLKRLANVDMTFVAYPGNGPTLNALLGGHVTAMFATYGNVAELLKTGNVRALAVATPTRIEPLPNVPTIAELGYPGFEVQAWFAAFAPAKTPAKLVADLIATYRTALQSPELKAKLAGLGLYPTDTCGADFAALLRKQFAEYGRVISEAHLKTE